MTITHSVPALVHDRGIILVAEDDRDLRETLATLFELAGCGVVSAQNGEEAIDYVELAFRHPYELVPPDLIVTDFHMPRSDGLDVIDFVNAAGWGIPVVVVTAFGSAPLCERIRQRGAADIFDKPFDPDALCARVLELLDG